MQVQRLRLVVLWTIAVLLGTSLAFAANYPTAPASLQIGMNQTFSPTNYAPVAVPAIAGNITALVMHAIGQTKAWQGYYGNITATITLDDANNFTFYNWSDASPRGQVYATLKNNIVWDTVQCFNYTSPAINMTTINQYYGIQAPDADSVERTFNQTDHPTLEIAARNLTGCPTTYIFQNDAYQQANFVNLLLWEQADNATGWIYTTMIENKTLTNDPVRQKLTCYNGQTCDFQLIVNENGHYSDSQTTTYYFWVELI